MRTGDVVIKGPMTGEEKARLDRLRERKKAFEEELAECRQLLGDEPDYEYRHQVEDTIAHDERILEIIRRAIPD